MEKNISKDLLTIVQRLEEIYQKANLELEHKEWLLEAINDIEDLINKFESNKIIENKK